MAYPPERPVTNGIGRYSAAVGAVIAGLIVRLALAGILGSSFPYITLFPAVVFASWFGGWRLGFLASLLSTAAASYFLIPPLYEIFPATLKSAVEAGSFLVVSLFVTILNEALRRSRASMAEKLLAWKTETERRQEIQNALDNSRQDAEQARDLLETILTSIGDAVIVTDRSGAVTFLNPVAAETTGWTQSEAKGRPVSEVFLIQHEKTRTSTESPVERILRENRTVLVAKHCVLINREGQRIPVENSATPIRNEKGQVAGVALVFRDVTDRRRSEQAQRHSEERLKLALEAGKIGVWDWDILENQIEWSELVHDIHGIPRGTFGGKVEDFAELIHPEDQEAIGAAIQSALRQDTPYDVEFRVVHPDGHIVWVATTARVMRNDSGTPIRMLGATTDITVRKQADADLREQWNTFDVVLSNIPDMAYIFDKECRFVYANRAVLSLFQKKLEEVAGKNFYDLQYPKDLADLLTRQVNEVIANKAPLRDQGPYRGASGELRYYEYIFVPILNSRGFVDAVAGTTRDITEQNKIEAALRASEERLTLALEAGGGIGTWDWDVPGDRVYANAPFAQLLGIDPERAVAGAPLTEYVSKLHPEDQPHIAEQIERSLETGADFAEEVRIIRPDGSEIWIYARGCCHRDADGKPVRFPGVAMDITARKRDEQALQAFNQELQRVNRELEEFAYVAGHDLQEPLRMVSIYARLVLENGESEERRRQYAEFVKEGVNRMEALIRDLLTYSKTVHDEKQPGSANLQESFHAAVADLQSRIQESGALLHVSKLPTVRGDTQQLTHVFQNLLSNAIKYRQTNLPVAIHISAEKDGGNWVVSVRDNGIGFEPQYRERIFGLFRRLHKHEYPGTGLGLAICKRIVERYGGRIWAASELGKGATFFFSLPAEDD